jgi:hypothetical protein
LFSSRAAREEAAKMKANREELRRTAVAPRPVTPPGEPTTEMAKRKPLPRYVTEANRIMGKYVEKPKTGHENPAKSNPPPSKSPRQS